MSEDPELMELLNETRILLPGMQVFLGFLVTVPFDSRFNELSGADRSVFMATFLATLFSLVCFVMPAAYHRIARPIHHKERFKRLANSVLIIGLVPMSISIVLATYLVTSIVKGKADPFATSAAAGFVVLTFWWVIPLLRAHDRLAGNRSSDRRSGSGPSGVSSPSEGS